MALWTPAEITTALWLDAADSSTITLVSDAVSEWADKSGNNHNVSQGGSTQQPAYISDELNGLNIVRFDGSDDQLDGAALLATNYTIAIVAKNRNLGITPWTFTQGATGGAGRTYITIERDSGSNLAIHQVDTVSHIPTGTRNGLFNTYAIVRDGTASTVTYNGHSSTGSVGSPSVQNTGIEIGAGFGSFGLVDIAEIVVILEAADETDRQKIEGYLAHKWGLEANLPSDHPYKDDPPEMPSLAFTASANLHGDPWLARVIAGRFGLDADLAATTFLGRDLYVGPFTGAADLSEPSFLYGVDGHLSLAADLHADPLRAYPMPRFVLGADLVTTGTYRGMYQTAGRFALEAEPHGDFHRIVWWQDPRPITAQQVYTCILTGHQDSTTDLALPMSSFQFRLYDHGGSYLSIVVPNAVLYAPQISARLNGQLVVRQGYRNSDGTEQLAEMARAGQITLRHDTGARNSSATLVAGETVQFSFDPGVVKKVTKLISRTLQADGNWQFRTVPIFGLFPGDSVEIDGTAWNVNRISVAVGKNLQTMDILSNGPS